MSYLLVINGGRLVIEDDMGIGSDFLSTDPLQALDEKADKLGLLISESFDEDHEQTTFFVGKMLTKTHIVQGGTICCSMNQGTDASPEAEAILKELKEHLVNEGYSIVSEDKGIIINLFG